MEHATLKSKLVFLLKHRRAPLFWALAIVILVVPWTWFQPIDVPTGEILTGHETYSGPVCSVVKVVDGDTLKLDCQGTGFTKVRLYCIDAPEMGQKPWGEQSKRFLQAITPKEVILVEHDRDRYGRLVGEVITTDEAKENLNLSAIWSGQAAVYPKYCKDQKYFRGQAEASKVRAGIWGAPGSHQKPWSWRRSD